MQDIVKEVGLSDNWQAVDSPPITPLRDKSVPPSANAMDSYFQGSISPQMQHDAVFVGTKYGSPSVPSVALMPVALNGSPANSAAIESIIKTSSTITPSVASGNMNWRGVWDASINYKIFDVVTYNISTYIALKSSTDVKPDMDATIWNLVSENFVYKGQWTQPNTLYTNTVLTITGVVQSGGSTIYSYSSFTGQTPAVGMSVTFSGWSFPFTSNNVTARLTAVSGGNSGTVTITNAGSTTSTGGTGTGNSFINGKVADTVSFVNGPWTQTLTNTIAGNILFAFAFWDNNSTATATITDTGGNTWNLISHTTGALNNRANTTMYLWYAVSVGGTTAISVTPNATSFGDLGVYEFQGPMTLDQTAVGYTGASADPTNGQPVTTTTIDQQVIAFFLSENAATGTSGGFTGRGQLISTGILPAMSRFAATVGTYTPGFDTGTTSHGCGCITTSWIQETVSNQLYIPYDVVEYLGSTYVCIAETTAVPTDTTGWVQLSQGTGGVVSLSGAYPATILDYAKLLVNTSSSSRTVTLPSPPPLMSWWLAFQVVGSGSIVINPNGLNIDGSGSNLTLTTGQGVLIFTDGTNYFTERGMSSGGFTSPMTTLGDMIYENAVPTAARLAGNTTSTKNFLTQTGTGAVSAAPAWGTIAAADVPNLDASKITTGQLALARGGTNADLSGTGGASQVLRQSSVGAAVTVSQLSYSDISGSAPPSTFVSGSVNLTAQAANHAAATLFAVGSSGAGNYLITFFIIISQAASSSSTLPDSRIIWTDQDSGATITIPITSGLTTNTLSTFAQGTFIVNASNSTNIQYDIGQITAYASSGGTAMNFSFRARAIYLG